MRKGPIGRKARGAESAQLEGEIKKGLAGVGFNVAKASEVGDVI